MRAMLRDDAGTLALLTLLLLPTLLIVLAGVLELGALRVVAERARIAADLATVTAVNDQEGVELARTGRLRPSADAATVARDHLALNLEPLASSLAVTPLAIAAGADVAVFATAGETDTLTGRIYDAPTVRLAADLPVRTPIFSALIARPVTVVRLLSASSAR